jgi:hypothetical protein
MMNHDAHMLMQLPACLPSQDNAHHQDNAHSQAAVDDAAHHQLTSRHTQHLLAGRLAQQQPQLTPQQQHQAADSPAGLHAQLLLAAAFVGIPTSRCWPSAAAAAAFDALVLLLLLLLLLLVSWPHPASFHDPASHGQSRRHRCCCWSCCLC